MPDIKIGKFFFWIVAVVLVVLLGFMYAPTVNTTYNSISTTGWSNLTKAGFAVLPFAFLGFIFYLIYRSRFNK